MLSVCNFFIEYYSFVGYDIVARTENVYIFRGNVY